MLSASGEAGVTDGRFPHGTRNTGGMTKMNIRTALSAAALAAALSLGAPAQAVTWDMATPYPGLGVPHQERPPVRRRHRGGDRRRPADHRPLGAIAVQEPRDQAGRSEQSGADRRAADGQPLQRGSDVRRRQHPLHRHHRTRRPGRCGRRSARWSRRGWPRTASGCSTRCHGRGRASTPRRRSPRRSDLESKRFRTYNATTSRMAELMGAVADDHRGRRDPAGLLDRHCRRDGHIGRDRREHQGVGLHRPLLRPARLDAEEHDHRERERLPVADRGSAEGRSSTPPPPPRSAAGR